MIESIDGLIRFFEQSDNLEKDTKLFNNTSYKIERMADFLTFASSPEKNLKVIHVAGSKGKGSVAHIISSLLEASGKKTALFTSPHVYDIRERFASPSGFFSQESYIKAGQKLEAILSSYPKKYGNLTTFEKYLAFAILLFTDEGVEYAVLETGLGGRLDATNAVNSFCQIFTTIELEHTAILGASLQQIAWEKSKIIKPHSQVFSISNDKCTDDVIAKEAEECGCKMYFEKDCIKNIDYKSTPEHNIVTLTLDDEKIYHYFLRIPSRHFVKDSAISILALHKLGLMDEKALSALATLSIPARFEIIHQNGFDIVIDGAHTPVSIRGLCDDFTNCCPEKRALIFGCAKDKDVSKMAEILTPAFEKIIILKPGDFKKSDVNEIYSAFKKIDKNKDISIATSAEAAVDDIRKSRFNTLVTGSFYLAEIIKRAL